MFREESISGAIHCSGRTYSFVAAGRYGKGFGAYDGKIMDLSLNEVDVNEFNYTQNRAHQTHPMFVL